MYRPQALCLFCGSNAVFCWYCDEISCLNDDCRGYHECKPTPLDYKNEDETE